MKLQKENTSLDALLVYIESENFSWTFMRRPQLGLFFLAQYAQTKGYKVLVDTLSSNDYIEQRLKRLLRKHSCSLLGFYVDQDNLWVIRRILPTLKTSYPQLRVILGGPQVTADPEVTLERIPETLCGVLGEGEETFVELLSLPSLDHEHLKQCAGLVIRNGPEFEKTPPRKLIDKLDILPIPRRKELTVNNEFTSIPTMITGRGCTGRCAFCFEGRANGLGKRLRLHSSQRCVEEFDYLVRNMKTGYICILDDTFVADTKRLREFCRAISTKYKGSVKWFCEARIDTLNKFPDLLPMMVDAGLIRMQVGGESGCQQILNVYRKGVTIEQIYNTVQTAKNCGLLSMYMNFIVGGAFETHETYRQTRDLALELLTIAPGCLSVGSSYYTPYPGTPMNDNPEQYGIMILDKEVVSGVGDKHVFCRTAELSKFDILSLGHDFSTRVSQKLNELSKQLPLDLIEKHFQACYKYNLSTEWYETLSVNVALDGYFKSIYRGNALSFEKAKKHDPQNIYPMRTIELVASRDKNYLNRSHDGTIREFDPLENMLLELSAGKLSLQEIVDIIQDDTSELATAAVRNSIYERYSNFDKEFLIVWKATPNSHTKTTTIH